MTALTHAANAFDLSGVEATLRRVTVGVASTRSRRGEGAGVVWTRGLIVTNAHCVRDLHVTVSFADATSSEGTVIARDDRLDLALIHAVGAGDTGAELADMTTLRPGQLLFAFGHPLGVRDALAVGVLHALALDRRSSGARWVCADIRLAPGNSGGPLADAAGQLVGINSMVVGGMGVAIPASVAQRFVQRVRPALAA